jgi:hypothetical protein
MVEPGLNGGTKKTGLDVGRGRIFLKDQESERDRMIRAGQAKQAAVRCFISV